MHISTMRTVRVLPHIKRLGDCFGDFLVRVTCPCGASRHIEPGALARIAGRSATLVQLATRMRCSNYGKKVSEVAAPNHPCITAPSNEMVRRLANCWVHGGTKGSKLG
jgi:hypothetical protein